MAFLDFFYSFFLLCVYFGLSFCLKPYTDNRRIQESMRTHFEIGGKTESHGVDGSQSAADNWRTQRGWRERMEERQQRRKDKR